MVDLLVAKDQELKRGLELAAEQAELQNDIKQLKALVVERDEEIRTLQKRLKISEQTLSQSLFEAREKLGIIASANKKPVSSEELIKHAYR